MISGSLEIGASAATGPSESESDTGALSLPLSRPGPPLSGLLIIRWQLCTVFISLSHVTRPGCQKRRARSLPVTVRVTSHCAARWARPGPSAMDETVPFKLHWHVDSVTVLAVGL
jgi:hypothetical protein